MKRMRIASNFKFEGQFKKAFITLWRRRQNFFIFVLHYGYLIKNRFYNTVKVLLQKGDENNLYLFFLVQDI